MPPRLCRTSSIQGYCPALRPKPCLGIQMPRTRGLPMIGPCPMGNSLRRRSGSSTFPILTRRIARIASGLALSFGQFDFLRRSLSFCFCLGSDSGSLCRLLFCTSDPLLFYLLAVSCFLSGAGGCTSDRYGLVNGRLRLILRKRLSTGAARGRNALLKIGCLILCQIVSPYSFNQSRRPPLWSRRRKRVCTL